MAVVGADISTHRKLNATDLEIAVAHHFDFRTNLIVPNIWWGLNFRHEIDVLVLTPSNYGYEIEIKVSAGDLRKDFLKPHAHKSNRLRKQYFCVTEALEELAIELVIQNRPHWGVLVVDAEAQLHVRRHAKPIKTAIPFTDKERKHLYELASMRIWTLKKTIADAQEVRP